jgi:hypothetical protein
MDALCEAAGYYSFDEELQQRITDIVAANGVERRQQIEVFHERPENRLSLERRLQQEKRYVSSLTSRR